MRSRRVILLIIAVWVFSLTDLAFTMGEIGRGSFAEDNPIAAVFAHTTPALLPVYKLALLLGASSVLLAQARHRIVEFGLWGVLGMHAYLALYWRWYYDIAIETINDPATNILASTASALSP